MGRERETCRETEEHIGEERAEINKEPSGAKEHNDLIHTEQNRSFRLSMAIQSKKKNIYFHI